MKDTEQVKYGDRLLSTYTVKEGLDLAGLVEGEHYDRGNLGMGVAALAISKNVKSEWVDATNASTIRIGKEINGALAALRRIDLNDERLPQSVIRAVAEARDRLREAGAQNQ